MVIIIVVAPCHREFYVYLEFWLSAVVNALVYYISPQHNSYHTSTNWASSGGTEIEELHKPVNTILLIRNPFDAIYELKQLRHEEKEYYSLFGKGNSDTYYAIKYINYYTNTGL